MSATVKLRVDITGNRYTRLTALSFHGRDKRGNALWLCQCDCGNQKIALSNSLTFKQVQSCGCLNTQRRRERTRFVGANDSPLYKTWKGIMFRCYTPSCAHYSRYGQRGIYVCERWHNWNNFSQDVGERPGDNFSLDRIDNDGPYSPDNCRWANRAGQNQNRSNTRLLTIEELNRFHELRQQGWMLSKIAADIGISIARLRHQTSGLMPKAIYLPLVPKVTA